MQYDEIVTVREVWDLLGAVGFKNKPRLMVMDYFDVHSTYVEDEMEVLKTLHSVHTKPINIIIIPGQPRFNTQV